MKYIINGFDMILSGIIMYLLYPILPKKIWIISEREDQAQDNGIAFFEYLNRERKEVESFYLLEKNCAEIEKVKRIGNVLVKGSLKHKIYFLKSEVVAFTEKNMIEPWGSRIFYRIFARLFPRKIKVFLQHGITDKDVSSVYGKSVSDIDLFVTATQVEKNFIEDKFGYDEHEIANVGFCRYDKLAKDTIKSEKIILYMPTWRRYLFDIANKDRKYIEYEKRNFLKSDYYNTIQELINDENLIKFLETNDYKFIFITHHGINEFKELFTTTSTNIEIHKSEEIKIAEILSKISMFITDYSSIHFDSAYIGKINIYYQFDREKFFNEHAGKSYFSYERDAFGPVVCGKDELIDKIIEYSLTNDNEDKYKKRTKEFFQYRDNYNCKRLYTRIENMLSSI